MPDDPHAEPLNVYELDGLCLPEPFIGYEGGLVVRTPSGLTVDCKPRQWDAHMGAVRPRHFGEVNENGTNSHLDANQVSLKKYGEPERIYRVDVPDGGSDD